MKKITPEDLINVPLYTHEKMLFINELSAPLKWQFQQQCGIEGDIVFDGVNIKNDFVGEFPGTALNYLKNIISAKNIPLTGKYDILLEKDESLQLFEEYIIETTEKNTIVRAGSTEGMRRAIYKLSEFFCESEGTSLVKQSIRRHSWVKRRISRCFFTPTYRPPFYVDELTNDIDYYPENYLERLAADGVNGLWLSIYFSDLESDIFPGRGKDMEKRFKKLRTVVDRCSKYGIKIYLYCAEPKRFGPGAYAMPMEDAKGHPELLGPEFLAPGRYFCLSSDTAKKYLRDSAFRIFNSVPGLGGLLNIIFGEDNGSCVTMQMYDRSRKHHCPICKQRHPGELFADAADALYEGMHDANPDAELICWFYAPGIRDDSTLAERLRGCIDKFPKHSTIMFNFESGGTEMQLGKPRNVYDYSLAFVGPSDTFRYNAAESARAGAKLQVCCSHEDAAVPFIPVPDNLCRKYQSLHEYKVETVLQCWYFGNYPGLMNRMAGRLSAWDFQKDEDSIMLEQARPDWGKYAPQAVKAWKLFGEGYREFPANIAFAWYGPLHNSIVWPLHLYPVDQPIAPSWILKHFPEISGDRIGECLIFKHTLQEAVTLIEKMNEAWQKGMTELLPLREIFKDVTARQRDIDLAEAIGIQIRSTLNMLKFYAMREDMLYYKNDHLRSMRDIVLDEIELSRQMIVLCSKDSRLGYHSEAENYLFYPEKLEMRIKLLEQLLEDFAGFDINADWVDKYTGKVMDGHSHSLKDKEWYNLTDSEIQYRVFRDGDDIVMEVRNHLGSPVALEIEPCRLWPPLRIDIDRDGAVHHYEFIHRVNPKLNIKDTENNFVSTRIPLSVFDDFRREGFPMRYSVKSENSFQKPGCSNWPGRLLHEDYNPSSASWLYDI